MLHPTLIGKCSNCTRASECYVTADTDVAGWRQFLEGLGAGLSVPPVKGVVFVLGSWFVTDNHSPSVKHQTCALFWAIVSFIFLNGVLCI